MLRPITIPDVLASDIPSGTDYSLVAGTYFVRTYIKKQYLTIFVGDFEEVYGAQENDPRGHDSQVGKWDAVLTCFFIDTVSPFSAFCAVFFIF